MHVDLSVTYRRIESRQMLEAAGGPSFKAWTAGTTADALSTNAGAKTLPFQRWHHLKEAFSPLQIEQAVQSSRVPVRRLCVCSAPDAIGQSAVRR